MHFWVMGNAARVDKFREGADMEWLRKLDKTHEFDLRFTRGATNTYLS